LEQLNKVSRRCRTLIIHKSVGASQNHPIQTVIWCRKIELHVEVLAGDLRVVLQRADRLHATDLEALVATLGKQLAHFIYRHSVARPLPKRLCGGLFQLTDRAPTHRMGL
jgi:hypothetical protein